VIKPPRRPSTTSVVTTTRPCLPNGHLMRVDRSRTAPVGVLPDEVWARWSRCRPARRGAGTASHGAGRQVEPADHSLGRSRGGLSTETHPAIDGRGSAGRRAIGYDRTAAQLHEKGEPAIQSLDAPGRTRTCDQVLRSCSSRSAVLPACSQIDGERRCHSYLVTRPAPEGIVETVSLHSVEPGGGAVGRAAGEDVLSWWGR
jgi:hypothetical protein